MQPAHIPSAHTPSPRTPPESERPKGWRQRLAHTVRTIKLPAALGIAVGIAIILTTISVWLYSTSGAASLDLSRPGFEQERKDVRPTEARHSYDTNSPVTNTAVDEFLLEYDTRFDDIESFGGFSNQDALSDQNLQLGDPQSQGAGQ